MPKFITQIFLNELWYHDVELITVLCNSFLIILFFNLNYSFIISSIALYPVWRTLCICNWTQIINVIIINKQCCLCIYVNYFTIYWCFFFIIVWESNYYIWLVRGTCTTIRIYLNIYGFKLSSLLCDFPCDLKDAGSNPKKN